MQLEREQSIAQGDAEFKRFGRATGLRRAGVFFSKSQREGREQSVSSELMSIRSARRFATASPLRYPGGKAPLAGFFADLIAEMKIEAPVYVEPFAGGVGAGLALLRDDLIHRLVINDIDGAVYCFWKSIVENTAAFVDLVADTPLTLDEWNRQKAVYRAGDERNRLALGFSFFYLNRTNRSGILHAGVIGGKSQAGTYRIDARFNRDDLIRRIESIGSNSERITVTDHDGRRVVREHSTNPDVFMYIDPPYVDMGSSLYLNAFTHRDHAELAEDINAAEDANWVLTYDAVPLIRELYAKQFAREYELTYSAYRPGKARELLVASVPVARTLNARASLVMA